MFTSFRDSAWCYLGLIIGFQPPSLYKPFLELLIPQIMIFCGFDFEMIKHLEKLGIPNDLYQ